MTVRKSVRKSGASDDVPAADDLQQRIAKALTGDVTASDLRKLIAEAENVADAAEQDARSAHARSLDPRQPDPAVAREQERDCAWLVERLEAALVRLAARLTEVERALAIKQWHADADVLEAERDALAEELLEYPGLAAKLADLFARIVANDKLLSNLNGRGLAGVSRRLRGAELVARGLARFDRDEPSIFQQDRLQLPSFTGSALVWPPRQVNAAVAVAETVASWGRQPVPTAEERIAIGREEQARISRFYAEQAARAEDRKNAEARAEFAARHPRQAG